jgi:high-affinity iron transporter
VEKRHRSASIAEGEAGRKSSIRLLASRSIAFLQQAGRAVVLTSTVWDSSRFLPEDGLPGRLLHSLVGYTDRPSGAQLVVYLTTLAAVFGLMRLVGCWRGRRALAISRPAVNPSV